MLMWLLILVSIPAWPTLLSTIPVFEVLIRGTAREYTHRQR